MSGGGSDGSGGGVGGVVAVRKILNESKFEMKKKKNDLTTFQQIKTLKTRLLSL